MKNPPELGAVFLSANDSLPVGESPREGVLALVSDRRLSLAALTALLLSGGNYRLVGEVRGTGLVRERLVSSKPAVIVLECEDGRSLSLVDASPWNGRVLILLDQDADGAIVRQAVAGRPHGYLSRGATRATLEHAIGAVQQAQQQVEAGSAPTASARLSGRQRAILARIASGKSTKEIAREYAIAPKTVANHVANIYQKLNVRHRGQLVLYAAQRGLATI